MSDEHVPSVGPVMVFTAKRSEVVRFYTEIGRASCRERV